MEKENKFKEILEKMKGKPIVWIVGLIVVVLLVCLFTFIKFNNKNEKENKQNDIKSICDITNNVCYANGAEYAIQSTEYIDDSIIIVGTKGKHLSYFLTDISGNFLKDENKKLILDTKNNYSFMILNEGKIYYDLSLIPNDDVDSFLEIVCGNKYKDSDIVSTRYYREYLGEGKLGKETLVETKKVSDIKTSDINWVDYCKNATAE